MKKKAKSKYEIDKRYNDKLKSDGLCRPKVVVPAEDREFIIGLCKILTARFKNGQ